MPSEECCDSSSYGFFRKRHPKLAREQSSNCESSRAPCERLITASRSARDFAVTHAYFMIAKLNPRDSIDMFARCEPRPRRSSEVQELINDGCPHTKSTQAVCPVGSRLNGRRGSGGNRG